MLVISGFQLVSVGGNAFSAFGERIFVLIVCDGATFAFFVDSLAPEPVSVGRNGDHGTRADKGAFVQQTERQPEKKGVVEQRRRVSWGAG